MERPAPRACLSLLWGCVLGAFAAQGKEGECVRGRRPSPTQSRQPAPQPRRLPDPGAPRRAQLWKRTWRRSAPARGLRLGRIWDPLPGF